MRRECQKRLPCHRIHRKLLVSDTGMHHDTYVTHVSWCMSGSLNLGGGKRSLHSRRMRNPQFTYLTRGPFRGIIDLPWACGKKTLSHRSHCCFLSLRATGWRYRRQDGAGAVARFEKFLLAYASLLPPIILIFRTEKHWARHFYHTKRNDSYTFLFSYNKFIDIHRETIVGALSVRQ